MLKNLIYITIISIYISSCDLKSADDYYNIAFDLEENGDYEKAIPFLDKAIEKRPEFRPALINRGADKSIIGDYNGAIEDYQKIIEFDPKNTMVLMNIGNNYKKLKQYEKSIEFYTKALNTKGAIKSDSTYLMINLPNEWDKDSDYYVRKYDIKYERGISYVYLKKYNLAVKDLEEAVKYVEDFPNAMSWLGEAYYHLNDTVNARKYLTQASKYGMLDAKDLLEKLESIK
ncbi:tetratricopeptide repeat protein [Aequorivita xiaoshiensis]|uniref:Tetratricopeptide repeat protein n=1 Tax=Aequorivita xiaoshiensis TaxID=2874476 RepID=A0A9X1R4K5_9FLAO|nr:tetratricopeptide repeat protein [Aequorivita xiaoshiensis]MCG2432131.1 tetratricopeptide repeat protein [Aequorivita xiaoshiensis]